MSDAVVLRVQLLPGTYGKASGILLRYMLTPFRKGEIRPPISNILLRGTLYPETKQRPHRVD